MCTRRAWLAIALGLAVSGLTLAARPGVARADVRLQVQSDRSALALGDTLVLQITVQTEGMGSPDITLPDFDGFEVVGQQVQRPMQFSFSFGSRTSVRSSTVYTFQLRAMRAGTLVIPPVRVELDGTTKSSQPLRITVSGDGAQSSPAPDPNAAAAQSSGAPGVDNTQVDSFAFIRTVVDRQDPFVGQQVTVTMYLYIRERLQQSPAIESEPTTDGLWTHNLLSDANARATQAVFDGAMYAVYPMRRFAAFPLRAGELTIGPLAVDIDRSTPFDIFNPGRASAHVKRSGLPTALHVKPLPEAGKPAGEVAVGRFEVSAKLDRAQASTGDAVTLTATVRGTGNIRTVQLVMPPVQGIESLAPEIKDLVEAPGDRVGGTREYKFLLVPRLAGDYTLPPLALATFDPERGTYVTKQSEPLKLRVVGNPSLPQAAASADTAKDAQPEPEQPSAPQRSWPPVRLHSALERGHASLGASPIYPWLLALPPLCWLAALGTSALRRRAAAREDTARGRALREAERHLREAERAASAGDAAAFHGAAGSALLAMLEARLGESVKGLTHAQLDALLGARGMEQAQRRGLIETLEQGDSARFGASDAGGRALDAALGALRARHRELSTFVPKEAA